MKLIITILVITLFTGCDEIDRPCNNQYCNKGIIIFKPCRGRVVIILDDNRQTIPCKDNP